MRRKFAANLLFLLTANLLVKPYWIFGVDRVVQNNLGPDVYGTYFAVFNYSFLLSIILDFGINNFNNRAISRNNKRIGEYLLNLMVIKLSLSGIYFVFTFISAWFTGFNEAELKMLLFLALNQVLLSVILYFRSNIAALQLFKTDSIISALDRLLSIVFCSALLYLPVFKGQFNIMWFIYAQTLALFITAIIALLVIARKSFISLQLWKFKYTKMILLKSAPFALLALLMGIYYRIDGVMILRLLPNGETEAGIYAASFRLLDAINQFGYLFATLLLPLFAGMIRKNENMRHLVKFSSELMLAGSVILAFNCYFFRDQIMHLLYKGTTPYWSLIFGWLMINFIPMSSIYIFGTLLTARGSLKILNSIALGGMVLNVTLNFFLIPRYGALGATMATLVTQVVAAVLHILAANKEFSFVYEVKELVRILVFVVLCWLTLQAVGFLPYNWVVSLLISSAACTAFAVLTSLLPVKDALALLRSRF